MAERARRGPPGYRVLSLADRPAVCSRCRHGMTEPYFGSPGLVCDRLPAAGDAETIAQAVVDPWGSCSAFAADESVAHG